MTKSGDRNMKGFYAVLALIAVVGVAAIAFLASGGSSSVVTLDPNLTVGTAAGYTMGSPDARIDVYEYGDFECGACAHFSNMEEPDVRRRLVESGLVRFHFVDFPLPGHVNSLSAHVAASCADNQSSFWPMHDRLFAEQDRWNMLATNNPKKLFKQYAQDIGLDIGQWEKCYDDREPLPRIMANAEQGQALGVGSTPTFRIGNKLIAEILSYDKLRGHVESALADTNQAGSGTAQK